MPNGGGMRKTIFFTLFFVAFSNASAEEQTQVNLKDNTVFYEGALSKEANQKLISLIDNNPHQIEWVSIKSKGGEVNRGMDLGEIIFNNNLGVEVTEYCLSSCANYVFSSAHKRRISNHAVIGFHGGVTGMEEATEEYLKTLPESQQKAARDSFTAYMKTTTSREAEFFTKVGVSQKITYLGQSPLYQKQNDSEEYLGWYYSLDDLTKLGIKNITVINPPWKFKQLSEKTKFFKVSVSDI